MKDKLQRSFELLKEYELLQKEVMEGINNELANIPQMEGVKPIEGKGIRAVIVSSSCLLGGRPWTPSYYIAEYQKEAIMQKLNKGDKNLSGITKAIGEMLKDKYVKIGQEKTMLNPNSLKVLQEIYDGLTPFYA